jgi:AmmeMemoRadiSam system protein B
MKDRKVAGASEYVRRRSPVVAGIFYPDDPAEARKALASFDAGMAETQYETSVDTPAAIVAPHAGWDLSGSVAADAFRSAKHRNISTIVIIGPLHRGREEGLFLSDSEIFETPLGEILVNLELSAELESCGTAFMTNDLPHLEEHSIEILLPFIKSYYPEARIVPVLVSGARPSIARSLALGLDLVVGPIAGSTLIVVSSNLCDNLSTDSANRHSRNFLALLDQKDSDGMLAALASGDISACGTVACAALMQTRLLEDRPAQLRSVSDSTSRPDHDPRKLVRYAALSF